jgi:hypothetical protein
MYDLRFVQSYVIVVRFQFQSTVTLLQSLETCLDDISVTTHALICQAASGMLISTCIHCVNIIWYHETGVQVRLNHQITVIAHVIFKGFTFIQSFQSNFMDFQVFQFQIDTIGQDVQLSQFTTVHALKQTH